MQFTDYDDLYFAILGFTSGPEHEDFALLPVSAQAMFIVAILDMEIQNGGLCQFFVNCNTSYAEKVANCLRAIGLESMAVLYESFLSVNHINPADLSSFVTPTVEAFRDQYERFPYDDFDNAYMELWERLHFQERMLHYASMHSDVFLGK